MAYNIGDKVVISRGKLRNETVELIANATTGQGMDTPAAWVVKSAGQGAKIEKESNFRAPVEPSITRTGLASFIDQAGSLDDLMHALNDHALPGLTDRVNSFPKPVASAE